MNSDRKKGKVKSEEERCKMQCILILLYIVLRLERSERDGLYNDCGISRGSRTWLCDYISFRKGADSVPS